jgi:hypothetical protein
MSAADYLSSTTNSFLTNSPLKNSGGGMAFDWATFGGFGIGAIGNLVGGIFQGRAQRNAAQIQANAANMAATASLYGTAMAMGQNRLDRGYRSIADLMNVKAAQDARTDNYTYGMNAFLTKNEGDIQRGLIAQAGEIRGGLAGKSMDALNSFIKYSKPTTSRTRW